MRNMHKIFLILLMSAGLSPAFANDIYITQSGAGLNLDLIQDGQNNVMGTTSARMSLTGTTSVLYPRAFKAFDSTRSASAARHVPAPACRQQAAAHSSSRTRLLSTLAIVCV